MAAGKSSRVNRKYKTKYKVRNWREYERCRKSPGEVTIWLSKEAIAAWTPQKNGLRGGQRRYSNLAILTALTLRVVFRLPLRQTEGFLDLLLSLMEDEGFIVAAELTASSDGDASTLPDLLAQIEVPIRRFTADGAYDHRSIYDRVGAAGTEGVVIVIPPRRSAVSAGPTGGPWAQREAALQSIHKVGRRGWQMESNYRQQAHVERGVGKRSDSHRD